MHFVRQLSHLVILSIVVIVAACNLYGPLESTGSDEARLEVGLKCLHQNDYICAIEQYDALSDANLKSQKLCTAYLAKAGFSLVKFLDTVNSSSSTLMGGIATSLLPWDAQKTIDADAAKTNCEAYHASGTGGDLGVLLSATSQLVSCASRLAKADHLVATGTSDTACATTGNLSGAVTDADLDAKGDGTGNVMCSKDVDNCGATLSKGIAGNSGAASVFDDLKKNLDALPADLKTSGIATIATRTALKATVPDN